MTSSFLSKILKKQNLLSSNNVNEYNASLEKLKGFEKSFNQGSFDSALEDIETYFKGIENQPEPIPMVLFNALALYIKVLIYKCKFDTIDKLLTKYAQLITTVTSSKNKTFIKNIINFQLLLETYYLRKGDYEKASQTIEKANAVKETIDSPTIQIQLINHLALVSLFTGDFQKSLQILKENQEKLTDDMADQLKIFMNNNLGLAYLFTGNLDESHLYFSKAKELAQKSNNKLLESNVNNNIGLYHLFSGNLQDSSTLLEENLQFFQQYDFNFELASTYINISSISEIRGEIVQSQADLTNAFGLSNELNNGHFQNICNNNLANLSFITGEFDSAKQTYLQCANYFESHKLQLDSIYTYFNLLSLAVLENDGESKQKYLQHITDIKNSTQNEFIDLIYRISRALDLKQYDRMVKKAEAQQIFSQIASTKLIQHEFKVIALKNLCELLIEELSSSGDQEVIDELKEVLVQLSDISERQNSLILKVESFLIQSKVDILEFKLNEARTLLGQAQTIAEEKGLTALAIFVSREYDNLLGQIAKFQDQGETNLSMNERLELAELESMVNKIIRKRAEIAEIKEESPFMFLIIAMSGMSIFSKIFVDQDLMDEQLIGGFITAINIVTQQAFSDQDAIEGIRHQDFTLLLKYLGSTRILCVYVFKGQTYFAMQKLKTFIETVQYDPEAMQLIDGANDIGEIISEEPALLNLVTKIFQETDENSLELAKRNFFSQKISSTINLGLMSDDVSLFC